MAQDNQEEEQELAQPYDTTFKDWIRQQPANILPVLLPGATYEDTLDVEVVRPTMRTDKVFKMIYNGKECILDVEFESGKDPRLLSRLLVYNSILYHDYQIPVMTLVVYPFRLKMAESPLRILLLIH
jgi:hypothetical protein